ncbi:isocitrate lyase/PEP mutase family protein [Actinomycetota bacterium]
MTFFHDMGVEKAQALRDLHHAPELLELVSVWDVASARAVADRPDTTALATASAAIAASHGYDDGEQIPLSLHLAAIERIARSTDLPVTADLERGYGDVSATVGSAIHAGAVGANIEDAMCSRKEMVERVRDAVAAGGARRVPLVLNARTDVYLRDPDGEERSRRRAAIKRGTAYLEAGADCVFVPGCTDEESIRAFVEEFGRGRLSLLAVPGTPSPRRLEELGVARLSHGPYPQRAVMARLRTYPR